MTNFQKRILTSLIALPISIYLLIIGGVPLTFYLLFVLFAGLHELLNTFKKNFTKIFLFFVLILSLYSIYYLANENLYSKYILFYSIAVCVSSDIGGYIFGKIFKWKKLTNISPKKTISGVFGSYFLSFVCLFAFNEYILQPINSKFTVSFLFGINEIFITFILSTVAQAGDLTISYFKRMDKIKDTGKILPGHGGVFDRIDGLMFISILSYLLYSFVT
tara:strand:+ start:1691 stop:2347 length:657 start_codon:yes stop_codon:yes gene_type:complete